MSFGLDHSLIDLGFLIYFHPGEADPGIGNNPPNRSLWFFVNGSSYTDVLGDPISVLGSSVSKDYTNNRYIQGNTSYIRTGSNTDQVAVHTGGGATWDPSQLEAGQVSHLHSYGNLRVKAGVSGGTGDNLWAEEGTAMHTNLATHYVAGEYVVNSSITYRVDVRGEVDPSTGTFDTGPFDLPASATTVPDQHSSHSTQPIYANTRTYMKYQL